MRVEEYAGRPEAWDAFVRASEGWSHFHLHGWREIIGRVLGHDGPYLAAVEDDGSVRGVLPLVRVKSPLFGHYLISMPFLNYGGPLGSPEAQRLLVASAVERARREAVDLLELRSRHPLDVDLRASFRKITVTLDLPREPGELWESLPSKVRSQVRRPRKEGVEVRFGAEQLGPFYRVFARHMRDLGTPVLSRSFFQGILDRFPADAWVACAYLREQAVAGGFGIRWGSELELTWAAALRKHSRTAPNMLLYWSFLERAALEGVRRFNFGRCSPGSGTHRFKRQWGGVDETLWWYVAGRGGVDSPPTPDRGWYARAVRIWQRVPVPIATALGPHIVRYLP